MNKSNASTFTYAIVFCLLAACIIKFPKEAFSSALDGLMLWFNVVCPALLPFFICVDILIGLGVVSLFGSAFKPLMRPAFNVPGEGAFGLFMSIASGYPVGARITARLRQEKLCTFEEGQRLLGLCSTSGPLFIIGAVATGIMNNPGLGLFLALPHYLSAITIGLLMRHYKKYKYDRKNIEMSNPIKDMLDHRKKDGRSVGMLIGDAVKAGVELILMIGGFIVFFSVITGMLKKSGLLYWLSLAISKAVPLDPVTPDLVAGILTGILEVTNGVKECAALQISIVQKVLIISFVLGFGGLSVNAQVMSIISETDLKFSIYLAFKFLQGIIALIYSNIALHFLLKLQVFNNFIPDRTGMQGSPVQYSRGGILMNSIVSLFLIFLFMLFLFYANDKIQKRQNRKMPL